MEKTNDKFTIHKEILYLSHELGRPEHRLVILGEGNTSVLFDKESFLLKASGSQLQTLLEEQVVQVLFDKILPLLDKNHTEEDTQNALHESKVNPNGLNPSVEAAFHAWLLKQESVRFVGHTHPIEVNKILCSNKAEEFANKRLFPDEIVCCEPKSLLIEYVNPGAELAVAIRNGWKKFVDMNGYTPKLILIKNHGLIAVGRTVDSVLATTLMAVKAAEIFNGAYSNGSPVFMEENEVQRIYNRADEAYRKKKLNLV